ncbi:hypothetical protein [Nocardia sp. NRRL S-836]|uniref:hypothetical protein n=1 Tax=Nocardia sp. NRRL S-836 TaxID=1519492 RepID=UPI000B2847E1|nr:hypothetical protein [Nocardia sp. NRRL S-836]
MSKRHNNVARPADRRAAARVKHDARARYECMSATVDLWRRGLLRTSREDARRGDVTVSPQYWRFLPQGVRVRLERTGWPEGMRPGDLSVAEYLVWDRQRRETKAASKIHDQLIRDVLRKLRPARPGAEEGDAVVKPAARAAGHAAEEEQHSMILRPFDGKVIPLCACGGLTSRPMGEPYAKGVYTRHVKAALQAAAAA